MKLLIIFPLLLTSGSYAFYKLAGPYECRIEGMTDCEDKGSALVQHFLKVRKVNATTRLLQGRADFKIPFDDKMTYDVKAAKWGSGGWGNNAYNLDGDDFCAMFRDTAYEFFAAYYKALGLPPQCPIPAGVHEIENGMELAFSQFQKFPSLPYGKYRAVIKFFTNKVDLVGCMELTATIDEVAAST